MRSPPALFALATLMALATVPGAMAEARPGSQVHGVPLPRGSRSLAPDLFASSRGFRKTVSHVERFLRRRGLPHRAVPVYRRRGVVVARFLSRRPASKWLAIHVFRHDGRTRIAIVPRPAPLTEQPSDGTKPRSEANEFFGDRLTVGRQTLDLSI